MKLDGLDHPKTLDLAARLDISLPQAIGHLELNHQNVSKAARIEALRAELAELESA